MIRLSRLIGDVRGGVAWGFCSCHQYQNIKYNKKVKKGKRVISYCIYSPYNNYCDGVDFVVDNKMVR